MWGGISLILLNTQRMKNREFGRFLASFDETVKYPFTTELLFNRGFNIFGDFAHNVTRERMLWFNQGWGLLNQFPLFRYFPSFSE